MAAISPPPRAVTVYEPTVTGLPPMGPYLRGIWDRRPFMWHLARTELKARHYDTASGRSGSILDPLLMAAVYYLLRTVVRPVGAGVDRNFLIDHLIWAVFFFQYTSKSLAAGCSVDPRQQADGAQHRVPTRDLPDRGGAGRVARLPAHAPGVLRPSRRTRIAIRAVVPARAADGLHDHDVQSRLCVPLCTTHGVLP